MGSVQSDEVCVAEEQSDGPRVALGGDANVMAEWAAVVWISLELFPHQVWQNKENRTKTKTKAKTPSL